MTLHFDWFHAPRWLAHAHVSRAVSLVLGVIGVSLLFGALRIVDAAVSGALIDEPAAAVVSANQRTSMSPDRLLGSEPPSSGASAIDTSATVEVPEATVEAISL
ncbi:MAG TPA: hypothetical protein VES00_22490 [Burkholderiaceae bacterium]|jgi:hypothetical protein|nr:hypothetical protein [Burkholderiaceae bacterium]